MERLRPWPLLFSTMSFSMSGSDSPECHEHSYALTRLSREQREDRVNHYLCSCQGSLDALNGRRFMPCSSIADMAFMCWQGLRGVQWHILSSLEDTSAKQNKESIIEIFMITGASFINSLSLPSPPKLDFQGKAAGRIIPPDLSPQSVKTLNMDGGRLGERKKVASVRL